MESKSLSSIKKEKIDFEQIKSDRRQRISKILLINSSHIYDEPWTEDAWDSLQAAQGAKRTEGRSQFTHQKAVNILGFYADQGNTLL